MTASDTLYAYEAGLITQAEATEQALVDRLDDLYEHAVGRHKPRRPADGPLVANLHRDTR